jgi:ankyrin repeat protein
MPKGGRPTALHAAATCGDAEQVSLLLAQGHAVDPPGTHGRTPLHEAAIAGHDEVVAQLLAAGARVDTVQTGGFMPLHQAVQNRHPAVVRRLLAAGGPVEARLANHLQRLTPLHLAGMWAHREVIELLLRAGADPGAADSRGRTALHWTIAGDRNLTLGPGLLQPVAGALDPFVDDRLPGVRLLLAAGADARRPDAEGRTARDYAEARGLAGIVGLFGA